VEGKDILFMEDESDQQFGLLKMKKVKERAKFFW